MSPVAERYPQTSSRPASIAELADRALDQLWDDRKDLKHYLRVAENYRKDGKELAKQGDLETGFVFLAKAATLVLEKLPTHRDYQTLLNTAQRNNLALNGQDILDHLSELKPTLVDRFDKWLQTHPDGLDNDRTPNAKQTHITDDVRAQAQLHATRFREEEQKRAAERQLREQQKRAAEEAARWRQQREEQAQREGEVRERRKNAAVAAAQHAVNLPPGYGSQHTIVLTDAARHQQQQNEFRKREEEINRKRAEQKRRHEQEAMARRQQVANDTARAVRHNIGVSTTPAGVPVSPVFSQTTPTPTSAYYPPASISYPSIPSASLPPSSYLTPHKEGPSIMPLESPLRYEGDSTDSESINYGHDHRRIGKQRQVIDQSRTPTRAPVRSSSYPPPITTTSPPPIQGNRIGYPQLMSPHQQRQGYYPSLNSMFIPDHQAPGPQSLLFDAKGPANGSLYQQSMLPQASAPVQGQGFYNIPQSSQAPHPHPQHSQPPPPVPPPPPSTYSNYPGPSRPAPPVPVPVAPPPPPGVERVSREGARSDTTPALKTVNLPRECLPRFLAIAKVNTANNMETCGLLLGKDKGHKFVVTTLLIPKQHSTSDTCTMDEEELVLEFTEERSLITLGWIHTHPSQSCFMSSVDLHTHSGFQRMLPESFAVVCAPTSTPNFGIFRLTDPPGLTAVLECTAKEAFHPHPDLPIYTDADKGHVQMKDASLEIVDLR